jgi:chromosome segregation ATPase
MAVGDNISNINSKAADVAAKAQAAKAQAQATVAEAKAKVDAAKAQARAAKKKAQELADKAKKIKALAEKQKAKAEQLRKSLADKQNFLKDQSNINLADAKAALAAAVLPLLTKFVNAEKAANIVLNKIVNDTKKKLKDKGRVEVVDGAITFIPKDKANYDRFKQNFDRKVNKLKRIIQTIKKIIDALVTLLKVLKAALIAFKLYLKILKARMKAASVKAAADLASISPSKPAAAKYTIEQQAIDDIIKPLEDKIDNYLLMVTFLQTILKIFQKLVNAIKIKIEKLSFTIATTPSPISFDLQATLNIDDADAETEYSDGAKNYTIKVITTPSGALQAVAYDSFSKLPITQTAPSRFRKADELIDELKQILG